MNMISLQFLELKRFKGYKTCFDSNTSCKLKNVVLTLIVVVSVLLSRPILLQLPQKQLKASQENFSEIL